MIGEDLLGDRVRKGRRVGGAAGGGGGRGGGAEPLTGRGAVVDAEHVLPAAHKAGAERRRASGEVRAGVAGRIGVNIIALHFLFAAIAHKKANLLAAALVIARGGDRGGNVSSAASAASAAAGGRQQPPAASLLRVAVLSLVTLRVVRRGTQELRCEVIHRISAAPEGHVILRAKRRASARRRSLRTIAASASLRGEKLLNAARRECILFLLSCLGPRTANLLTSKGLEASADHSL